MRYSSTEEVMYGKEPTAKELAVLDADKNKISNFTYRYKKTSTPEQRRDWFLESVSDPEEREILSSLPVSDFLLAGIFARLRSIAPEVKALQGWYDKYKDSLLEKALYQTQEEQKPTTKRHDPSETKEKDPRFVSMMESLEAVVDDCITGKRTAFSMADWLKAHTPSPKHLSMIRDRFRRMASELEKSFSDEYLREAYSCYSAAQKKTLLRLLYDIIETKKARKPRRKKERPAEKILEKVKYMPEDKEHGVKSLPPKEILGASTALVWNSQYRIVYFLEAEPGKTLTIKGTTIQNIDEVKSFSRRIRKPHEVLPALMAGGKVACRKTLQGLTTKDGMVTGRLSDVSVILRVF